MRVTLSIPPLMATDGRDSPGPCMDNPAYCFAYPSLTAPLVWGLSLSLQTGQWPMDVGVVVGTLDAAVQVQALQVAGSLRSSITVDLQPALGQLRDQAPAPYTLLINSSSAGIVVIEELYLQINRAPTLQRTEPGIGMVEVHAGQSLTLQASAIDPDGDPLTYRWSTDDSPAA